MSSEALKFKRKFLRQLEELAADYPGEERIQYLIKLAKGEVVAERMFDDDRFVKHILEVLSHPEDYTHTVVSAYYMEKPLDDYGHGYREDEYILPPANEDSEK